MSSSWYDILSSLLGWSYFVCWSISFYPQLLLNLRRRSVVGLSVDFLWLNALGFTCYSLYSLLFLASDRVREEYRFREGGEPLVRVNDAAFAIHALLVTTATIAQVYLLGYTRAGYQKLSGWCRWLLVGVAVVLVLLVGSAWRNEISGERRQDDGWLWIDIVYALSYIKLGTSAIKMLPQLYLNWARKSTRGWSVVNVLLDFSGGVLSVAQIVLDAAVAGDLSAIRGNPVKTGLGLLAIAYDVLFICQHYFLYGDKDAPEETDSDALERARRGVAGLPDDERQRLI
ncbi:hypothetical protein PYCC9005_005334 [Savitreella phatthalungensis]